MIESAVRESQAGRLAVGVGCRPSVAPETLLDLVHEVLADGALDLAHVGTVATIEARAAGAPAAVARALGVPLKVFSAPLLAAVPGVQTRSGRVAAAVGTPSVAEAAALAAAGPGARLVVPRRTRHACTCAVAVGPAPPARGA